MSPRTGRPTSNPKSKPIHVRLDAECEQILKDYTAQKQCGNAEAIRRGIMKLAADLKK